MPSSLAEFIRAVRDPRERRAIGLNLTDPEAASILSDPTATASMYNEWLTNEAFRRYRSDPGRRGMSRSGSRWPWVTTSAVLALIGILAAWLGMLSYQHAQRNEDERSSILEDVRNGS